MFCKNCGKEINGSFCPWCGTKVDIVEDGKEIVATTGEKNIEIINKENKTKSKKKIFWLTIIFIVLSASILGSFVYFSQQKETVDYYSEPKTFVSDFLNSYKAKQLNTVKYLEYSIDDSTMNFEGFQGLFAEQIEYTILDANEQEEYIIVNVEIKNIDFKIAFNAVLDQLSSDPTSEEILNELKQKLSNRDCPKKIFQCEVLLTNNDGYKIVMTDSLSNALLGGYNEYLAELTTIQEGTNNE